MRSFIIKPGDLIPIGRAGENQATQIRFDVTGWADTFGAGTYTLVVKRPHEDTAYPVEVTVDGDYVVWTVSNVDTGIAGNASVQLRYVVDGTLAKSVIYNGIVGESLDNIVDPPDPFEDLIQRMVDLAERTEAAAESAAGSAQAAEAARSAAASSATAASGSATAAAGSATEAAASATAADASADAAAASAATFETDPTLSIAGKAADAKKTGDEIADLKRAFLLETENIENTVQTISFAADGSISSIVHKDGSNNVIRTDAFTFGSDTITETRTLYTGEILTIETNTNTLTTTVTYTAA